MKNPSQFKLLIDGEWVGAAFGETFESLNPATGEPWAVIPAAGEEDVNRAVAAASRALSDPAWAGMTATAGGVVITGGKRPVAQSKGWYFEPTIIDCPSPDLPSVRQELFGPVISQMKFATEDEAVDPANDTRFGLAAGIFTRDVARSIRVSKAIRAGIIWVNTYRVASPIAPFGGFKNSGYGREGGVESILDYTRVKTVWINTSSEPMANPFVMR